MLTVSRPARWSCPWALSNFLLSCRTLKKTCTFTEPPRDEQQRCVDAPHPCPCVGVYQELTGRTVRSQHSRQRLSFSKESSARTHSSPMYITSGKIQRVQGQFACHPWPYRQWTSPQRRSPRNIPIRCSLLATFSMSGPQPATASLSTQSPLRTPSHPQQPQPSGNDHTLRSHH